MNAYRITALSTDGGVYGTCATGDPGLVELFDRWLGAPCGTGCIGVVEIRTPDGALLRHQAFHDAPCPGCGQPVAVTDDAVWTCPADLAPTNPYHQEPNPRITEQLRQASGVFSNCGEDHGLDCHEPLPLHAGCYQTGGY